ncbi:hypothetical protein BDY21DRAFT_326189 [Lineolata rhizophorae]|uniref:Amidohydrolase-related domain-containing protein n=1 Tax=Lineolata rhizophorae TaxID=578093 RepID=A0A6A6NTD1_9PEZI|nr:hypothetical protein BDY21DRAFT_326189 [Lineolata rhizophorae]
MADSFIVSDVRIFTGEDVIENGFVVVSDSKIKSFDSGPAPKDSTATVISKPGHTLLPGLIDAHIHADKGNPLALTQALRFGVTTVMDMHNEPRNISKLSTLAAESKEAADIKFALLGACIENGWPVPVVTAHDKSAETMAEIAAWPRLTNGEEAAAYVASAVAGGASYIKLMHESGTAMGQQFAHPTQELQEAVVRAAHEHGKPAVAHATCLADTLTVLRAGVDGLTHTFCDQPPTQELTDAYKANNAWVNPTLAALGSLTKEGQAIAERFAHDPRVEGRIDEGGKQRLCQCMGFSAGIGKVEYGYESVRQLKAAGIDVICGSDSAGPALGTAFGLSIHHELYLMVTYCGFTPQEALRSATSVTARRFGFNDRGQIAEGLKADLTLVEGNPLENIDATLNLRSVWRDGHQLAL